MKLRRIRPSQTLLLTIMTLAALACAVAVLEAFWPALDGSLSRYGGVLLGGIALVALLDLLGSRAPPRIEVQRWLPASLSLGQWTPVQLRVRHDLAQAMELELYDHYPVLCTSLDLPLRVRLRPGQYSEIGYRLRPLTRGLAVFPQVEVRCPSRLKLWDVQFALPVRSEVKIYPNFSAVVGYSLLATDNHTSLLGIKRRPRRGAGTEFHQLREYREGDATRQIDWKATSRRLQLISREYQDERDQQVVLMLDSGRRMRTHDVELSHFDHALNASLMLAHVALRQGDSVGMMSFGQASRWVPAVKGVANMSPLLNGFYDLYAGPHASDYLKAGQELMLRQRKRSLVVLLTNLRDEDMDDLLVGIRLLRQRHLVLLANLREDALDQTLQEPVKNFDQALLFGGTVHYLKLRRKMQERLQAEGVLVLDCSPRELTVRVINRYLEIKRSGLL